jgi:hypothetical protein
LRMTTYFFSKAKKDHGSIINWPPGAGSTTLIWKLRQFNFHRRRS